MLPVFKSTANAPSGKREKGKVRLTLNLVVEVAPDGTGCLSDARTKTGVEWCARDAWGAWGTGEMALDADAVRDYVPTLEAPAVKLAAAIVAANRGAGVASDD